MFPRYGKWLQRERRMVSEGVGARIHRQPWIAGGDSVVVRDSRFGRPRMFDASVLGLQKVFAKESLA